jgi:hypothetical protein
MTFAFGLVGCGGSSSGSQSPVNLETPAFFFGIMETLKVDFGVEPGAEPYSNYDWTLIEQNLKALFEGRARIPAIGFPKSASETVAIPPQKKENWSLLEIVDLAKATRPGVTEGTTGRFYIMFLNGYLNANGASEPGVIGVSIRGTTIIAMFKDVIRQTGARDGGPITRFVEGSTILHEMGHALGLVNNGVTLRSQHHDAVNGAHCSNQDCVMFYANEGGKDASQFWRRYRTTQDPVIFDTACLQDARQFVP